MLHLRTFFVRSRSTKRLRKAGFRSHLPDLIGSRILGQIGGCLALFLVPVAARCEIPEIRHIVIIIQENRTPDNLFQGLPALVPGADIATTGRDKSGKPVPLDPEPLSISYDVSHSHRAFVAEYDGGKMDGWNDDSCEPRKSCPANAALKSVRLDDVAPYVLIAAEYGFANRMFQTNQGPSYPAHQFLLAGTSQISPTSPFFASENMADPKLTAGCAADPKQRVQIQGPGNAAGFVFPCFEHLTLPDLLDQHTPPLSWRYYTPSEGSIWTAPNSIHHMCQPKSHNNGKSSTCDGSDWRNGRIVLKPVQVLMDVAGGDLASVSWVIPRGQESDHALATNGSGPSWVASIVNAIGASPYWKDTAILITWDDWGGWYDHVPPPKEKAYGYYEYGFRVPLLVVSPYAKRGYVSNVQHDFGSILAFIEQTFSLGTIPPHTFADSRGTDALADFFDFENPPRDFSAIPAPRSAESFLADKSPALPPDDD